MRISLPNTDMSLLSIFSFPSNNSNSFSRFNNSLKSEIELSFEISKKSLIVVNVNRAFAKQDLS